MYINLTPALALEGSKAVPRKWGRKEQLVRLYDMT